MGEFGACLGELVCAVCGRVWCGFGEVSLCFVWENLVWVPGAVKLCCLWECLGRVLVSEFVLCVGQFGVGLGDCVCAV